MDIGEVGKVGDYNVYIPEGTPETRENKKAPLLLLEYDDNITSVFVGIDSDGNLLQTKPSKKEAENECNICGSDLEHLHSLYKATPMVTTIGDIVKNDQWEPLSETHLCMCPRCEEKIYKFTQEVIEEYKESILKMRV